MIDDRALMDSADAAAGRAPVAAALALAGVADCDVAELDARLLELHVARFGARLEAVARCPACDEELELALDAAALVERARGRGGEQSVDAGGARIRFRTPRATDLEALAGEPNAAAARAALAARCVVEVDPPGDLTEAQIAAMAERMAERDPLGGSRVAVDCPACGARGELTLDVGWIVGRELAAEAARLADDVHALASAYGWSETEILALPPTRRARYLERVAQ